MMEESRNIIYDQGTRTAQASLLRSVYVWMTLALVITGLVAGYVAKSAQLLTAIFSSSTPLWMLLIAEIGLVWYLSARITKISFMSATLLFILYSILNGVTLSCIFVVYTMTSIASTFLITAGTFGVMAVYGSITRSDLTRIGNICLMALIGIIIATVVNLFMHSEMMSMVISYIGVLLFVGLTAYDAQKIKRLLYTNGGEVNEMTQKIALLGALSLYLDFVNLFLYLLRILGDRK